MVPPSLVLLAALVRHFPSGRWEGGSRGRTWRRADERGQRQDLERTSYSGTPLDAGCGLPRGRFAHCMRGERVDVHEFRLRHFMETAFCADGFGRPFGCSLGGWRGLGFREG